MRLPTLKAAFVTWVLLNALTTFYAIITGAYQYQMSLAVDKAGPLPTGISHQEMVHAFIAMSLVAGVGLISIAGFLVWKASKNNKWAIWSLTAFSLWQAFDSVFANIQLAQMYPGTVGVYHWLLGITNSLIWLYIIFAAHLLKKYRHEISAP